MKPSALEEPVLGWRYVKRIDRRGREHLDRIPLTVEDVLHPHEDDQVCESSTHNDERNYLLMVLRQRLQLRPHALVLSNQLIDWGIRGLGNHSPDIVVFDDLQCPVSQPIRTFRVKQHGARCLLAVEIVSPSTRNNDVTHKVREYFRAKVPLYVLVDEPNEDGARSLLVYERGSRAYRLRPLATAGRAAITPVGLELGLVNNHLVCWDAFTGKEMVRALQLAEQLDFADQPIQESKDALEQFVLLQREMQQEIYALRRELQELKDERRR